MLTLAIHVFIVLNIPHSIKGDFMPANPTETNEPEKKSRIYRVPVVVLYKSNGMYCAQIAHPTRKIPKNAIKKAKEGINTALGQWIDIGYSFGTLKEDVPDFVELPKDSIKIGCKAITQVPFPI
jgi:hypothetical protein